MHIVLLQPYNTYYPAGIYINMGVILWGSDLEDADLTAAIAALEDTATARAAAITAIGTGTDATRVRVEDAAAGSLLAPTTSVAARDGEIRAEGFSAAYPAVVAT